MVLALCWCDQLYASPLRLRGEFQIAVKVPASRLVVTCSRISGIEGIQDHIAAGGVVKSIQITAVGVGDDGAVAALESTLEQLADGGGFAGAGGADHFEVFGFVGGLDRSAGSSKCRVCAVSAFNIGGQKLGRLRQEIELWSRLGDRSQVVHRVIHQDWGWRGIGNIWWECTDMRR
jgi:hypothetical protein